MKYKKKIKDLKKKIFELEEKYRMGFLRNKEPIKDLKQRIDLMEFFKVPLGGVKEDGEDFFYTIEVDDLDNPISLEDDWKWIEDVAILFTFEKEVKKFVEGKTIEQYNINKLQEFLGLDNITSMEILEPSNPYDMSEGFVINGKSYYQDFSKFRKKEIIIKNIKVFLKKYKFIGESEGSLIKDAVYSRNIEGNW